ncbi:protein of unknown function [Taphrina deformans PYCC 5710]|uniref:Cellular morphogenesis protein n=1 Tax=Taphrina deformans (strain PYCC 5710 / ATCC 11124 / CBS 356.35 / IMI 108563 / JCM 9778 / NBRC 8474) TaxID=1097556 RepID=R4XEC0_TAPDE|nr:protein of unknown function [Taphrina deformans PYCC 5710]|eukprot:CCG84017.1 protein of unknown function [Taphrina deformans PYCC 5710]
MRNVVAYYSAIIVSAVCGSQIANPPLDLSSLGHVAIAGQFSGISIYDDTQQTAVQSTNSKDGLYLENADGSVTSLGQSDGMIYATCSLNVSNVQTIYLGGNFSRIGNISAVNMASYTPSTNLFSSLSTGVLGTVRALYCDATSNQVYIGGEFEMSNSTNTVLWDALRRRYVTVPFGGFDGPVNVIRASGSSILFGGQFDSLSGETASSLNEAQQVNLQTAYINSPNSYAIYPGFSEPSAIICPSGDDGEGNTWLLADNSAGSWSASTNFTFRPISFRIYNTHLDGRGTREFRFIAQPVNGILNLTYTDPSTGEQAYCDSRCPLSDSTAVEYQEFKFVNVIEMNGFQLAISGWYGQGGGLRGLEVFTDDIYAYAIQSFNEPTCANSTYLSTTTNQGAWRPTILGNEPGYLAADLSGDALSTASVTFEPQISQRGNYTVRIYTPGCLLDNTCPNRGGVTLSVYSRSGTPATNVTIFQTNNYDKYDTIFQGLVDPPSSTFRPRVVLSPLAGQAGTINTVASRVQFLELSASASTTLNGLYEYNLATFDVSSAPNTTFDNAGSQLVFDAVISAIVVDGPKTYVAGNFTGAGTANILTISGNVVSSLGHISPNGAVNSMLLIGQILYLGGNFTALANSTISAAHIVAYNTSSSSWLAVGAGTNGPVVFLYNNSGNLGISGPFDTLNAYGSTSLHAVAGNAFWDTTNMRWTNSNGNIDGNVRAAVTNSSTTYLAGNVRSTYQVAAPGIASLTSTGNTQRLSGLSLPYTTSAAQRFVDINTGAFYNSSTSSLTIVAGQLESIDSSGSSISHVAFLNANGSVSGIPSGTLSNSSVIYTSHIDGNRVLLGGALSGTSGSSTLGGLFIWDLESQKLDATQPAALQGSNVRVNSITTRPGVAQIVVAGNFDSAGSLTCPSLCVLDRSTTTWQRPAIGLSGNVSYATWLGQNVLLLAGNMTLNGTTQYLATFDFSRQTFSPVTRTLLPGPALVAVSDTNSTSSIYIAGTSLAGAAYLVKWDGNSTVDLSTGLSSQSQIYDLQFVPLSRKTAVSNSIMDSKRALLVLGNLTLATGNIASGALFDGAAYTAYLLSNTIDDRPGSVRTLFSDQLISFTSSGSRLSRGVVVVIALAIALFITFAIVALGILAAFIRRRREGYRPANQTMPEKAPAAVPPQSLFGEDNFQAHKGRAPRI